MIKEVIPKLKKKFSCESDGICVRHFEFASDYLFDHIALLFQMIFTVGVVPDCLCVGVVTPVLKKGKPLSQCSSYRPITVSSVFSKIFELLIIDHIRQQCVMPPFQFGFQPRLGCYHALRSLCTILKDAERSGSPLAIGAYALVILSDLKFTLRLCLSY